MLRNCVIVAATSMILVLIAALGVIAPGHATPPGHGTADSPWDRIPGSHAVTVSWDKTLHIPVTTADSPWD